MTGVLGKVEEVSGKILKFYVKWGCSISGKHGIGVDKRCCVLEMFKFVDLAIAWFLNQQI